MVYILGVLLGFVVFCLIMVILLQEGKGGGITAMGGAAMDSFIGAKNPLRKITVVFSIIFLVLVLAIGVSINSQKGDDVINQSLKTETPEQTVPAAENKMIPVEKPETPATTEAAPIENAAAEDDAKPAENTEKKTEETATENTKQKDAAK